MNAILFKIESSSSLIGETKKNSISQFVLAKKNESSRTVIGKIKKYSISQFSKDSPELSPPGLGRALLGRSPPRSGGLNIAERPNIESFGIIFIKVLRTQFFECNDKLKN